MSSEICRLFGPEELKKMVYVADSALVTGKNLMAMREPEIAFLSRLPETPSATAADKIDHAINRAIQTTAHLHFEGMWVPNEYKTVDYLFGQDERVFAFETFRRWLKNYFFCNTEEYKGITWLNRHMFATEQRLPGSSPPISDV